MPSLSLTRKGLWADARSGLHDALRSRDRPALSRAVIWGASGTRCVCPFTGRERASSLNYRRATIKHEVLLRR